MPMQAVILAGGLGTRLRSIVNDRPKPMALVNGKPFLEYQLNYLKAQNVRRILILCGHMADLIQEYFGDGRRVGLEISYAVEKDLKGTGGAILNAANMIDQTFLLLNGDTFVSFNLDDLRKFHNAKKADITMLAMQDKKRDNRYGTMVIDMNHRIVEFFEKESPLGKDLFISCGVYIINKTVFNNVSIDTFSLERDFLAKSTNLLMYAYVFKGSFIDIGTPKSYQEFIKMVEDMDGSGEMALK